MSINRSYPASASCIWALTGAATFPWVRGLFITVVCGAVIYGTVASAEDAATGATATLDRAFPFLQTCQWTWDDALGLEACEEALAQLAGDDWRQTGEQPPPGVVPSMVDALVNKGLRQHRLGDLDGAIADYSAALSLDETAFDAYLRRAEALMENGDHDAALADLDAAIALRPQDEDAVMERGLAYLRGGDEERAAEDIRHAIELAPHNYFYARTARSLGLF